MNNIFKEQIINMYISDVLYFESREMRNFKTAYFAESWDWIFRSIELSLCPEQVFW